MSLETYRSKRDFTQTPEPRGGTPKARRRGKPKFVVQMHQASHLHYDLRLEIGGVLKSWAVPRGPSYDPGDKRASFQTEDHPVEYASFEGVIPPGNYGAGAMIVWDEGTMRITEGTEDPLEAIASGKIAFVLEGTKLKGEWALVKLKGKKYQANEWLLIKHRDGYVSTDWDVTVQAPWSIRSGLTLEELIQQEIERLERSDDASR
jgi:bifunctional non-homologous end joining protein LigD